MASTKKKNEIIDFYKLIPKNMSTAYHNPKFKDHGLKIPLRALIVGGSGAGKTQLLMNIIHKMSGTFERIVICLKCKDEPLYNFLASKCKNGVSFHEGADFVPDLDSFKDSGQTLVVFDDLVNERDQSKMIDYYIRARKIGKGVSCIYLTQSYYKVPKTIRINCNYLFLKKLSSTKDLNMILSENSLGVDKKQLHALYKFATKDKLSFFLIDVDAEDDEKFRHNFLEILSP